MKVQTKFKLLSCLLVMTMLLTMAPFFAAAETVGNSVDVFLSVTPSTEYRDGTVNYTVTLQNNAVVPGAKPAWVDVVFIPPAADGTATGTPVVLATDLYLAVGAVVSWDHNTTPALAVSLAYINDDVTVIHAKADYTALYDATPPYDASGTKNVPVTILEYAELGDFVWNDLDRDGIQDVDEPGIEGVTVNLWSADPDTCAPIEIIDTTATDPDGYYLFDGLKAGKYRVQFVKPDGDWVFTQQFAGIDEAVDSNADPATGISDCVVLAAGDSNMTIDAGLYLLIEELTVSKTALTTYIRTHEWDIDKRVETEFGHTIGIEEYPKIWLWIDGSGDETATWYVDVTYVGYLDSGFNVSGFITIENTGELDAVIQDVDDLLGGMPITVHWPVDFDPGDTLAVGETLILEYSENVDSMITGINEVTVTTLRDEYYAQAVLVWGAPYEEYLDIVDITDISDLFGSVDLGTLYADDYMPGDVIHFDYDMDFAWTDYFAPGPYTYDNIAIIEQTQQSADATLKVNWMEPAELGDFVWNDLNRNGIQDAGEPGINDVSVNLYTCAGAFIASTTTDVNGYYLFADLMPGDYKVEFILPAGDWAFTAQYQGGDPTQDSNADIATGMSDCVTLAAGESNLTIDAGMYALSEDLTVRKTAVTSFIRTHEWDIDKRVETEFGHTIWEEQYPKIWLYEDGTGNETATWYVDVTYLGYEDSDFNVSGVITIVNTGDLDVVIVSVADMLGAMAATVNWPVDFEPGDTLAVGETLVLTYSADVATKVADMNVVTVTTQRDIYNAEAAVVWGDPDEEILKVVDIVDVSDLFGNVPLGTLDADDYTAGDIETFSYSKFFAWTDYSAPGPYVYDNTATIVQTGQYATAKLVVNWEEDEKCWGDETAWAYGGDYANPNWDYVSNRFWGWTNGPIGEGTYVWDIYAGAGQNILDNGIIVGELTVVYIAGTVTVTYQMDEGYYLGETHLWVGNDVLPKVKRGRTNVYTNAPGQFPYGYDFGVDKEDPDPTETSWTWSKSGFTGNIYVAAHAVVWMEVECQDTSIMLQ